MSIIAEQDVSCPIRAEADLLRVREVLRELARNAGLGIVDQTKVITAGSELARNILKYAGAGGGELQVETCKQGTRVGVRATFSDQGPGIPDIPTAMTDGFSTGGSLGIGLPGSKRLVDEFDVTSAPNEGTRIVIVKWGR